MSGPDFDDLAVRDHLSGGLTRSRVTLELRRAIRPTIVLVLFAAVAAVAAVNIVTNISGGSPLADRYNVRIAVSDASGVVPGSQEVRISGVPVGRIVKSELRDGQAVLTLSILSRYGAVYRDATLRLRPNTPLEDLYVDVVRRGTSGSGRLAATEVLPVQRTNVAVRTREALDVFEPPTRARMQQFIDEFGRGVEDGGDGLRAAFAELSPFLLAVQRLTRETAERDRITRRLVHNLRLITDELGRRDAQLRYLVRDASSTFSALAAERDPLERLVRELPPALAQTRTTFATLRPTLARTRDAAVALGPVAAKLRPAMRSLEALSGDARPAFRALRPPVRRLAALLSEARPLSTTLAGAFEELRPSAPRLDRVTNTVVPCKTSLREFFNWSLSVFKFADQLSTLPRGEAVSTVPGLDRESPSCAPGGARK